MDILALDIRTLSIMTTCIAILFAIFLFAFGLSQKSFKGFNLLAFANLSIGLGFFLLIFRNILPDFITIIVANTLSMLGIILYFESNRRFLGIANKVHKISILILLMHIGIFLYYTYQKPSVNIRIVSICLSSAFIAILTARDLFRNKKPYWRVPAITMGFIFASFSLFQIFRSCWTIKEKHIDFFLQAGTIHALTNIFIMTIVIGPAFGFVWMVSKELEFNLTKISHQDQLTNILNRRGLECEAHQKFSECNRFQSNLTALMIDIDHFKKVNDTYGHEVGDDILVGFVSVIRKSLRPYDIFARVGGEEFVVILSNTTLDQALLLAERIRKSIESFIFDIDSHKIKITASLGLFNATSRSTSLEELLRNSDKALYYSKQHGRNKVTSFSQI